MPPKKKQRTEDEAGDKWYAIDLKKKAKQINLLLPPSQAKTLNEALSTSGGKLDSQRPPILLTVAGKGLEARIVPLAEMQTYGAPGWWQTSSQYATPEDAARIVLVQQQKLDDVQGKRPWRLLVREAPTGDLGTILADPARQDWQLSDVVRSSASLISQAGGAEDGAPREPGAVQAKVEAGKDLVAGTNGMKEDNGEAPDGQEKQADGQAEEQEPAEEEQEEEEEEEAEAEQPQEREEDALEDSRERLKDTVTFLTPDTTMNVMQSRHGGILMTLNEGGLQYLLAGARANIGMKAGRYMFEARIVEHLNQSEVSGNQSRSPVPRNLLRVGVSLAEGPLIIGDSEESICFDSEGNLVFNRKKTQVAQRFTADNNIAVVINLCEGSPNASTISLFKDGERACEPQALPESLQGKALYPCVTFKNVSLHVHFGPYAHAQLPFKCRTLQEAAKEDVVVRSYPKPADGKHEVMFPVMLPDEGTFDWVDWYIQRNPQYTELSERTIVDWATRSGLWRPKSNSYKSSLDKPDMNFGIPHLDDGSVKQVLQLAATVQQRDFVVMEIKSNLLKQDRTEFLERFKTPLFKRVARVMMGEPSQDYKEHVHSIKLAEKQASADEAFRVKKQEKARKKLIEVRQKQVERARKRAERIKRKADEVRKKREEAERKLAEAAEGGAAKPEQGEADAAKEEAKEETKEEAKEEAKEEPEEEAEEEEEDIDPLDEMPKEEEDNEQPPKVTLTEAEKRGWFNKKPGTLPDVSSFVLSQVFSKFSLPEEAEGFDEVSFDWQKPAGCHEHIRRWNLDRKIASRVDDLQPSEWFKEKWHDWQRDLSVWHQKHQDFKDLSKRPQMIAAAQREKEELMAAAAALADALKLKGVVCPGEPPETKDGDQTTDVIMDGDSETKPLVGQKKDGGEKVDANGQNQNGGSAVKEEKTDGEAGTEKKDEDEDPIKALVEEERAKEVDLFSLTEISDAMTGEPLYANFAFEDWALLSLRFELHLLCHAFRRDCNDPERTGIHPDHLAFYYNKYYKKGLNPKNYGVESVEDLVRMIRDTVVICMKVIESQITDDLETNEVFVKLTEEARRERQRRLDSGDQTAKLHFTIRPQDHTPPVFVSAGRTGLRPSQQPQAPPPPQPQKGQDGEKGSGGVPMPVPAGVVTRPVRMPSMEGKGGGKGYKGPAQQWGSNWYGKGFMGKMGKGMMGKSGPYQKGKSYW